MRDINKVTLPKSLGELSYKEFRKVLKADGWKGDFEKAYIKIGGVIKPKTKAE